MRTKIATALIYLCAAVTTVGVALTRHSYPNSVLPRFALLLAAMLLVVAGLALRYRPTVGHWIAFVTSTLILTWLCRQPEFGSPIENAWIALNIPDNLHEGYYISDAKLTILAIWFIVVVIGIATLRLVPVNWTIRGLPIRNRTWPPVLLGFIVLGVWFSKSVSPYRIAGVVDANYSNRPSLTRRKTRFAVP